MPVGPEAIFKWSPITSLPDGSISMPDGSITKAVALSGRSGLLFLRDSVSGAVVARIRTGAGVALNSDLHAN